MRLPLLGSLVVALVVTAFSSSADARRVDAPRPKPFSPSNPTTDLPPDLQQYLYEQYGDDPSLLSAATADTFHLAWWSFNPGGSPDPQGWTAVDVTAQPGDFFHVSDATELDGGDFGRLIVLDGAQSMWCGAAPNSNDPYLCSFATLPGYGAGWDQSLVSKIFTGCDSIDFCYKIIWDSEPGYDITFVQWRSTNPPGPWNTLSTGSGGGGGGGYYTGWPGTNGPTIDCLGFRDPTAAPQIRFNFVSDGAWNDQDGIWPTDGAVILDSITVRWYNEVPPNSGNWVVSASYFEDFEDEAFGAHATDDGVWTSVPHPGYGSLADLYSGLTVLQQDPCLTNASMLWAFFDDPAVTNYACGGHSEQGAIPYGPDENGLYMYNSVESPLVPITGAGDDFRVRLKVYRNLPLNALVFWDMDFRNWVGGCPDGWLRGYEFTNYGDQNDWLDYVELIGHNVDPAASHLQIRLEAFDLCDIWCGIYGTGSCHTQGPLFDNVEVMRINHVGPQFSVRHIDLFQDTFAEDGTTTGTARADMAQDIAPSYSPGILPGDSICATVAPVGTDVNTGVGPSVYCYVAVWPQNQAGKTWADLEAPETRAGVGKRFPFVGTVVRNGVEWGCFRADAAVTQGGGVVSDRYCFDLNDWVFTPGDTICYVLGAEDGSGNWKYFSRTLGGQDRDFVTEHLSVALRSPMEFTILPSGRTTYLYVDDADDRGGPPQIFFDSTFHLVGPWENVDRYDVLGPSSVVGNSLASRVKSVQNQIVDSYRTIIWNSGDLSSGLIGDGTGNPEKSDDYLLLFEFLDTHYDYPGVYISGDDVAEEWVGLAGAGAVNLRTIYMNFNLVSGDHVAAGEPLSPLMTATGPAFIHLGVPDQLIAFGGCPSIRDFDVLQTTGMSTTDFPYPNGSGDAVISQMTLNSVGTTARVVLSGFSYDAIRDLGYPSWPPARSEHEHDILSWLVNLIDPPVGITNAGEHSFLENAAPNPFNPETVIRYGIRERGHVSLRVYNVAGQLVRTLVNEVKSPREGGFAVAWDGMSDRGEEVATGVYFYKLVSGDFAETRKMVLLK